MDSSKFVTSKVQNIYNMSILNLNIKNDHYILSKYNKYHSKMLHINMLQTYLFYEKYEKSIQTFAYFNKIFLEFQELNKIYIESIKEKYDKSIEKFKSFKQIQSTRIAKQYDAVNIDDYKKLTKKIFEKLIIDSGKYNIFGKINKIYTDNFDKNKYTKKDSFDKDPFDKDLFDKDYINACV